MSDLLSFSKYHGTGNDFILIDNRKSLFDGNDTKFIHALCHRRFGIGSDGLMLLEESDKYAFSMRYYNSDGNESTMCGNGGRCIAAYASDLGIVDKDEIFEFEAVDGLHRAIIKDQTVILQMVNVKGIQKIAEGYFLDTGSPHFVCYTHNIGSVDAVGAGRSIRNNNIFGKTGTNVNFVENKEPGILSIRTYERGVEDETWSCGTGCVASVLVDYQINGGPDEYLVDVRGGQVKVRFTPKGAGVFEDIWLEGTANFVFEGRIKRSEQLSEEER